MVTASTLQTSNGAPSEDGCSALNTDRLCNQTYNHGDAELTGSPLAVRGLHALCMGRKKVPTEDLWDGS